MNKKTQSDAPLVSQTVSLLRDAILRAQLEPGCRLHLETLQSRFGLSSSPLREALNRLAAEGFVDAQDRRGFHVKRVSIDELKDITRVRILLEKEALHESLEKGDDEWEARIIGSFHALKLAQAKLSGSHLVLDPIWSARHREFHSALMSACQSLSLLDLCKTYYLRAERYRHLSARYRQVSKHTIADHEKLLNVALARDTSAMADLITKHIQSASNKVGTAIANYRFDADNTLN